MGVDLSCLEEFYSIVEDSRMKHLGYGENLRKDNTEKRGFRNAMISFLEENVKEGSVYVDLFSGDAVVPLALLYLSNEFSSFKDVGKIYAVDSDERGALGLVKVNAEFFGLGKKIIPVKSDVCDQNLVFVEPVESSFMTDISGYVSDFRCVRRAEEFFFNARRFSKNAFASQAGFDFGQRFFCESKKFFDETKHQELSTVDGLVYSSVYRSSLPD
jgi:hypothetical protein